MTKKRLLRGIRAQIRDLGAIQNPLDFELWKSTTLRFIENAFPDGKDSTEYVLINQIPGWPSIALAEYDKQVESIRFRLNRILQDNIRTISTVGIPRRGNLLISLPSTLVIAVSFATSFLIMVIAFCSSPCRRSASRSPGQTSF